MGVRDLQREKEIWGSKPRQNMQLQIAVATWRIKTRSDSAFDQITLVLVAIRNPNECINQSRLKDEEMIRFLAIFR